MKICGKNIAGLLMILWLTIANFQAMSQNGASPDGSSPKSTERKGSSGPNSEKAFLRRSEKVLNLMEQKAKELQIVGVAIIGYIPGEQTTTWLTKMRVVKVLANDKNNYLGIAYSKACDMAVTLKDSGSDKSRKPLGGELGYRGGLIKRVKNGWVLAVFSGGKTEQDLQVAQLGLDAL